MARPMAIQPAEIPDRYVCNLGVLSQTFCNEEPVEVCADGKTDGNPASRNTGQICGAGQTHKQPAGHIGRLSGHGYDPGTEPATAEKVFISGTVLAVEIHADTNHKDQIACKSKNDRKFCIHCFYSPPKFTYIFIFIITKISVHCKTKAASFQLAAFVCFVALNRNERIGRFSRPYCFMGNRRKILPKI